MDNKELDQLIEQGEMVREKKNWDKALEIFDRAIIEAARLKKPETIINILAHKLIIYKHLYNESGNQIFLELLYNESKAGIHLADVFIIQGQARAVSLLRVADYYYLKGDYKTANKYYYESLENLNPEDKAMYGEYLGHLGLSEVLSGEKKKGFATLDRAYEQVFENKSLRPFHKLVILSGIRLRQAKAFGEMGDKVKAKIYLDDSEQLAKQLVQEYKLPLRLEEVERLRKELGF